MTVNRPRAGAMAAAPATTLVDVMAAIAILAVAAIGATGYRYCAAGQLCKAEARITAARLASMLLNSWKAAGGYSGYIIYELDDPADYDPTDPNDYNPNDTDGVSFSGQLAVFFDAPGPPVPAGFSSQDSDSHPNYRILINGVNYYATLSYKDEVGEPRILNVCVAWMDDYQTWSGTDPYRSVQLTTYAEN